MILVPERQDQCLPFVTDVSHQLLGCEHLKPCLGIGFGIQGSDQAVPLEGHRQMKPYFAVPLALLQMPAGLVRMKLRCGKDQIL